MPSALERYQRNSQIVRKFNRGLSVSELSEEFELSENTIKKILKEYEEQIRFAEERKTQVVSEIAAQKMREAFSNIQENMLNLAEEALDIALAGDMIDAKTRLTAIFGLMDRGGMPKRDAVVEGDSAPPAELPAEVVQNFLVLMKNTQEAEEVDLAELPRVDDFDAPSALPSDSKIVEPSFKVVDEEKRN